MSQSLQMKIRGLYTFPNDMSAVPEGALSVANNIVIDKDSIAEPRRGLTFVALNSGVRADFATNEKAERVFFYKDGLISLLSNSVSVYNHLKYFSPSTTGWKDSDATWNVALFSDIKPQHIIEDGNLYITTADGLIKLDALNAEPDYAGVPQARDIVDAFPTLNETSEPRWLASGDSVYYRTTILRTDANGNTYESAPSSPYLVTNNSSGDRSVNLVVNYPTFIRSTDKIRLYRSKSSTSPEDELKLCYEEQVDPYNPSSLIIETCPDELLGAFLYSNASQGGVEYSNYQPPLAKDIALYKDSTFLGNITEIPRIKISLKATDLAGSAATVDAIRPGDTVVVNGVTYTGVYAYTRTFLAADVNITNETITIAAHGGATGDPFRLYNTENTFYPGNLPEGTYYIIYVDANTIKLAASYANALAGTAINILNQGTASVTYPNYATIFPYTVTSTNFPVYIGGTTSQNVTRTMMGLARVITDYNYANTDGVNAYYLANITNDLLGSIVIERKSFEATNLAFSVNSSRPQAWVPNFVYGALTASVESKANGLAYSKPELQESFPIPYREYAGSRDEPILRIITLRDSLFILKTDGVWRLWGTDPGNYQIALLDSTVNVIAPDSVVALNNQIFALTTQGVVSITENGVTIVSRPIERDLLDLLASNSSDMFLHAFAVGYESERAYTLFLPTVAADTYPTQYYRYNVITNNWTRGTLTKNCGGVNPYDDRMYLGDRNHTWMDVERKTLTSFDYADYVATLIVSSASGSTIVFNSGSAELVAGRVLYQTDLIWGEIASVTNVGAVYTVIMKYPITLDGSVIYLLDPIETDIEWVPNSFQNPGINKHYREATLIFLSDFYGQGRVSFETDQYPQVLYETIEGSMASPWGLFPWGIAPWGGNSPRRRPVRIAVPRNHKRASWLKVGFHHDVCFSPWKIQGISVIGTNISEKVGTDT